MAVDSAATGAASNDDNGATTAVAVVPPQRLVGFANFKRHNPRSDRFRILRFHHVELWCGDATTVAGRFSWGLGMPLVAKSDLSTGNPLYCSHVLQSHDLIFVFTAPYSPQHRAPDSSASPSSSGLSASAFAQNGAQAAGSSSQKQQQQRVPLPYFSAEEAQRFFSKHGLAVRAVAVAVESASDAYRLSTEHGATGVQPPTQLVDSATGQATNVAEVALYGDVVLRYVEETDTEASTGAAASAATKQPRTVLPNYAPASNGVTSYGLTRLDHAVGNVPELLPVVRRIVGFTGMHEFAEFTAADVGTVDSGLNSMVLANNEETVLLPLNEPTHGTRRKSQIQTYLEHNEGPGLQHLALKCHDIVHTLQEMRARSQLGGFDFMPRPSEGYYRDLQKRIGRLEDAGLTEKLVKECEALGILVDRDDQGTLLQIFTRPVGDRPTLFLEIIQRVGCMEKKPDGTEEQRGGCGGFGKGNFSELFKSIEDFERTLDGPSAGGHAAQTAA